MSEVERLRSDLKVSEAKTGRYQEHIKLLEKRHLEMEQVISALGGRRAPLGGRGPEALG